MKILLIDDNRFDRALVMRELAREFPKAQVVEIPDPATLAQALAAADFDVVITDYQLQWSTGTEIVKTIKASDPEMVVIMFTGTGNETVAVEAIRAGLDDYVIKSAKHFVRLPVSIRQALEKKGLRRAEQKAVAAVARLHSYRELILDSVADGIIGLDQHGRHTFANPAARQMLGYDPEELEGREGHSLWHHSCQDGSPYPLASCPVHAALHSGKKSSGQDYFWRKNGSGFLAEFTVAPIHENNQCIGVVIIFRDISEREKNYEELRKYRQIVSASQEHLAFVDAAYICRAINDACLIDGNKKREQIIDHHIAGLLGLDFFKEKLKEKMDRCLAGEAVRFQEWFAFPNKERWYMDVAYYPYRAENGDITGLVVNARDMTAIKKQEDDLRHAEQEWEHTFNSISDFVSVHDSEYRFVKVNRSLTDFLGMAAEDLIGRHCHEVFHGLHHAWDGCPHMEVLRTKHAVSREVDDPRVGRPLLITVSPIFDDAGRVRSTVHIARDLSALKKAEKDRQVLHDQLVQSQKMECVGQLAGGVAHDFNNYLTTILGFSEMILLSPATPKKIAEDVRSIREAGERSACLVRQLLAFSRKQILEIRPVDIDALIENLAKMLKRLISESIELLFRLQAKQQVVMADPTQIEQVIMNLVVNARDAMPEGGQLSLETVVEDISQQQGLHLDNLLPGKYLRLTVRDTGNGIPREIRARIFEPFFTTKEKGKGTGLGLATVFGIVAQHNGRIFCESELGAGSSFQVFLPVVSASHRRTGEKPLISLSHGSETILLVEDDPLSGSMLCQALTIMGYRVLLAETGDAALKIINSRGERIDLLITDVVLPGLSGPDLANQVRENSPASKVLFISGYSDERIVRQGVLKPGINFLSKPISLQKLSSMIREILDN